MSPPALFTRAPIDLQHCSWYLSYRNGFVSLPIDLIRATFGWGIKASLWTLPLPTTPTWERIVDSTIHLPLQNREVGLDGRLTEYLLTQPMALTQSWLLISQFDRTTSWELICQCVRTLAIFRRLWQVNFTVPINRDLPRLCNHWTPFVEPIISNNFNSSKLTAHECSRSRP